MDQYEKIEQTAIRRFGTPLYLFEEQPLLERMKTVRESLPGIGLCYAMKAAPALAGIFARAADRLEVCSPGEYEICHRLGGSPEKILVSGVNKTESSMRRILSLGGAKGMFTIESAQHFQILEQLAKESGDAFGCYIRLSSGNQFGVDKEEWESLCQKVMASEHLHLLGLHYFSGTQKTIKRIEKELQELSGYGKDLEEKLGITMALEYGPGLSVNSFCREEIPKTGRDKEALIREREDAKSQLLQLKEALDRSGIASAFSDITFEYGRFLAACGGSYYAAVADLKTTEGTHYAILEGGLHQISYFGSMAGMKTPYIDVMGKTLDQGKEEGGQREYLLAGSLCSVNDVLVRKAALPHLAIGDVLKFSLAGAYCSTEGMSLFLSRDLPALAIAKSDGTIDLIRDHMETNTYNVP